MLINTVLILPTSHNTIQEVARNHSIYQGKLKQRMQELTMQTIRKLDIILGDIPPDMHKIVVGHYPIRSIGVYCDFAKRMSSVLLPILCKHHVHKYICGHEHNMQHHCWVSSELEEALHNKYLSGIR